MDVGRGDMIIARYLKEKLNCKIIGLDVIDENLANLPMVIYVGNKFPFPDNYFDFTYTIFSLHHCQNLNIILNEMERVTKNKSLLWKKHTIIF